MEIYLLGARLFMIIEADESFSFDKNGKADASNPKVQEWEQLMWKYQQPLAQAKPGEKWMLIDRIFKLPT
jgi:L-rhamnose mutarotase